MSLHEKYCLSLGIEQFDDQLSTAKELVKKHLANYSFGNTEILLNPDGKHLLTQDYLFEKIVSNRRGGYCFEHNNLMFHVLCGLGFDVTTHLGRVVYGEDIDVPRTHQFNKINIGEIAYLVDVGFGPYTPAVPVPFNGENDTPNWICQEGEKYELKTKRNDKDFVLYTFILDKCTPSDFMLSHYYTSTHPDSKFVTTLTGSRIKEEETVFINDSSFSRLKDGNREDIEVEDAETLHSILTEELALNYDIEHSNKLFEFVKAKSKLAKS